MNTTHFSSAMMRTDLINRDDGEHMSSCLLLLILGSLLIAYISPPMGLLLRWYLKRPGNIVEGTAQDCLSYKKKEAQACVFQRKKVEHGNSDVSAILKRLSE